MPDITQALFEIETYGFTLLDAVLAAGEAAELRSVNERLLAAHGKDLSGKGRAKHITNLPTLDPAYFKCIDHPRVLPILEAVMGPDIILASLNSRVVPPGGQAQDLHADLPAQYHRSGPPVMMNSIWLLDDFTESTGATRIVPGSQHRRLERPPRDVEVKHVYQVVAPAGSVLVFNGQCWHGGGANRTDRPRHAVFGHYRVAPWMRFEYDPRRDFPEDWIDRLSGRQKELMRMQKGLDRPAPANSDDF